MGDPVRLAAARVLVWRGERVAVVRNVGGDRTWWSLPGGGVEGRETLAEAAVREAREELGLDVRLLGVAFVGEHVAATGGHTVSAYFHAEVTGGTEDHSGDPVGVIQEIRWLPPAAAGALVGRAIPPRVASAEYRATRSAD